MNGTDSASEAQTISEAEGFILRYVVMAPGLAFVLALWILATYLIESFDAFPYLAITSATKRCGKTRVGELLGLLCARVLATVSTTPAVIFRSIAESQLTLILDEAETLSEHSPRAEALREILNAGNRKGSTVRRCEAPSYKVREFPIYCPKVIILIGELSDTLADRCIHVQMRRRLNELIQRFRLSVARTEAAPIRDSMTEWAERHSREVTEWYHNNSLDTLRDREEELWLPIFAVCAVALPERLAELRAIAERLSRAKDDAEPQDAGVRLLGDMRAIFTQCNEEKIATSKLLDDLNGIAESPWPDWSHGRGLKDRSLARLLSPFSIQSGNLRFDNRVVKGYKRESFKDAWERYLDREPHSSRYNATEPINTGENGDSESATQTDCSAKENGQTANKNGPCSGVADEEDDLDAAIAAGNAGRSKPT